MISNLLDNAIKYTPSGGEVSFSIQIISNGFINIIIKDTGIGISKEDIPHIFKRFYRCDQSRSTAGTGLGLSLARAVAKAHGGEITVESRPGEGSAFTVALPSNF
jgi:signal transduction histidine kinase